MATLRDTQGRPVRLRTGPRPRKRNQWTQRTTAIPIAELRRLMAFVRRFTDPL